MSGNGRGTARISPFGVAAPIVVNILGNENALNSYVIVDLGDGRWCFSQTVAGDSQVLTADFEDYDFGGTKGKFQPIPLGSTRGVINFTYTPGGNDSQLEIEILWDINTDGYIFTLPGTIVLPNVDDPVGGTVPPKS